MTITDLIDRHGLKADSPWVDLIDAAHEALADRHGPEDADAAVEKLAQRIDNYLSKQGAPKA